jgi:glycine hydroxymethyltransferase
VCNKNLIPNDERSAVETSGIRLGTPALTSRDMREPEMLQIGKWVSEVVHMGREDEAVLQRIRGEVTDLCAQFPIYYDLEP